MRWGLVALTTAMFLFSTITLALNPNALSFSYIDSRGHRPLVFSGPLGYWLEKDTIGTILTIMISLNQWLADGLSVGSMSKSVSWASNSVSFSSSTVVMLFMIRTTR